MLFILNGEIYDWENTSENGKKVINMIQQEEQKDFYLTHAEIDGEVLHEDIDLYIEDHIHFIDEIKVEMLSEKQLKQETLKTMKGYIDGVFPAIDSMTGRLYANEREGWQQVPVLLEGIEWIVGAIGSLSKIGNHLEAEEKLYNQSLQLTEQTKLLEEPLNTKDAVLLADVISYEVVPELEDIQKSLSDFLDEEVTPGHAN